MSEDWAVMWRWRDKHNSSMTELEHREIFNKTAAQ